MRLMGGIALALCGIGAVCTVTATTASAPAAAQPTNQLTGDQASFTGSTGGWVGTYATLSWVSSLGDSAPGALTLTATGGQGMAAASGSPTSGGLVAATPGFVYTGSAASQAATQAQEVEPVLAFYASSGELLASVFGPTSQVVPGEWTEATPVAAVAPSGTTGVALFVEVPSTTAGEEIYVDDAWMLTSADDVPSVDGPLHTSGNQILAADGSPVTFHGVVMDGLEYSSTAPNITAESIAEAKAWGANFIRLPLGEQFLISSNCDYDPNYSSRIAQVVNYITSLGMVALLDLHWNTVGGCGAGSQHNMADEAQSPEFWSQVAAQFASNPLVAFDLYNEPHNISDAVWLNGGTTTDFYAPYQTYQAAGMQQLYDSVRATGAQNLVFITGNNWGNTVPSTLVSGTNIVYAAHVYTCPSSPPPSCTTANPYDPSQILDNWVGVSSSVPVMVTEFGWPSQYDGTYNSNAISFAEAHGWGWSAFRWEQTQNPTSFDLTSTWLADGTAEPAPSGMPVLCSLVQLASGSNLCSPPAPASVTPPPNPPPVTNGACASHSGNEAFLCAAYLDLLGRTPDPGGLATFDSALASGVSRTQVAYEITSSPEYQDDLVNRFYSSLLGRSADLGGLAAWTGQLASGATDQAVEAQILGSDEFYTDSGGSAGGFVNSLYTHLLGRSADTGGLETWEGQLGSGVRRTAVAGEILASAEYLTDFLSAEYVELLGRGADPGGLASWVGQLQAGASLESVISGIVGSDEFYADATR